VVCCRLSFSILNDWARTAAVLKFERKELTLRLAQQTDAGSSSILRNEFDTCFFQGITQFRNCPFLRRQRARLSFKPFYAGQRYP
jgi:hypothetical protein